MGKIHLLNPEVINRISAAQVVGAPCDVVKELVENSIDAGATKITVEVENAGISKIRILDNGSGIFREDVKTAFMSHATSKISTTDDIENISTLGFRGEALASIANVSRVTILTKTLNEEVGSYMEVEDGEFSEIVDKAANVGTCITVYNLFAHIPARKKFLRNSRQELSDITKVMNVFILAHPEISFLYIIDNDIFYQSNACSLKDAIFTVYGQKFVDKLIEVDDKESFVEMSGYMIAPPEGRNNDSWQTVLINGRYVVSECVSIAVRTAYSQYLMKGMYPAFVLNVKVPYDQVDINASPDKTKARFVQDNYVHGCIYRFVTKALLKYEEMEREKQELEMLSNSVNDLEEPETNSFDEEEELIIGIPKNKYEGSTFNPFTLDEDYGGQIESLPVGVPHKYNVISELKEFPNDIKDIHSLNSGNEIINKVSFEEQLKQVRESEQMELVNKYKIVGVLFSTYIIIERDDNIVLIDQHAAHERMIYDKFLEEYENNNIVKQPLLAPYIFSVNQQEETFLNDNIQTLSNMGFDVEMFGFNTYKVAAIPSILININLKDFFSELFGNLSYFHGVKGQILDKLATKACKAAIKAGQTLSTNEIEYLLKLIKESKTPLLCPHGRPYTIQLPKYELEKLFKRKV